MGGLQGRGEYVRIRYAILQIVKGWVRGLVGADCMRIGNLNQAELSWVLQPLLSTAPSVNTSLDFSRSPLSTLHLHNTLIACLYANCSRDSPPADVAPWVVATDKPAVATKNASASGANDKAEERLKKEIMSLHARDRRRIKTLKEDAGGNVNDGLREIQDYHNELAVKPPTYPEFAGGPQSAGGMGRSNYEMESRRRYAQPLASETLEFPTHSDVQNRIEPIAVEEGLAGSTQSTIAACAELVEQATEVYLKEMLGNLRSHARSNGEGCIQTAKFRRQLQREEEDAERGIVQRNPAGLLPVEMEMQAKFDPLSMEDLRLSMLQSDIFLRQDPFLEEGIWLDRYPDLDNGQLSIVNGAYALSGLVAGKGKQRAVTEEPMHAADEGDFWQGSTSVARDELMGVLDDCLAVG